MRSTLLVSSGLYLLAGKVLAAPSIIPPCYIESKYRNIIVSPPYELPPRMGTGYSCDAFVNQVCEIDVGVSHAA